MKDLLYSCLLSTRLPSGSRTLNWHLETIYRSEGYILSMVLGGEDQRVWWIAQHLHAQIHCILIILFFHSFDAIGQSFLCSIFHYQMTLWQSTWAWTQVGQCKIHQHWQQEIMELWIHATGSSYSPELSLALHSLYLFCWMTWEPNYHLGSILDAVLCQLYTTICILRSTRLYNIPSYI